MIILRGFEPPSRREALGAYLHGAVGGAEKWEKKDTAEAVSFFIRIE